MRKPIHRMYGGLFRVRKTGCCYSIMSSSNDVIGKRLPVTFFLERGLFLRLVIYLTTEEFNDSSGAIIAIWLFRYLGVYA